MHYNTLTIGKGCCLKVGAGERGNGGWWAFFYAELL